MEKNNKFISFLLGIITIILFLVILFFGYIMYNEITGNKSINISFAEDFGFPKIEFGSENEEEIETTPVDKSMYEGINDGNTVSEKILNRHLYEQLDNESKIIYDKLYNNKEKLKTGRYTIEFGNTFSDLLSKDGGEEKLKKDYQSAIEAFIYENPEMFYIDATNMYINIEKITRIIGVKYNVFINTGKEDSYLAEGFYSADDINKCENEIKQVADKILAQTEGKSDYQKIKIIHDYLVDNIEYDETVSKDNIYNIYGALVLNKCVCEGYAKAFQYLANMAEIENTIVIGTGKNSEGRTENHAWNYVKLYNNWYAIDTTWDDPIIRNNGVLSGMLLKQAKQQYFLKGSDTMNESHFISGKFTEAGQVFEFPELSVEDYNEGVIK